MWHVQGCLLPMLQYSKEEQRLMLRRLFPNQGWEKLKSHHELTVSLLNDCEPPDCAKRTCPGIFGGVAIVFKVCTNWFCRFYKMTGPCTEVPVEVPEPPYVVQNMTSRSVGINATSPKWLRSPCSYREEEDKCAAAKAQDDELYIPGLHKSLFSSVCCQPQFGEALIFIYTSGSVGWKAFSPQKNSWIDLPHVSVNPIFEMSDKESIAAGNHLLWFGMEGLEFACFKYDHLLSSWERGPCMLTPRLMSGSATCGQYAYLAGGCRMDGMQLNVLNTAERYDSTNGSWELLAPLKVPRLKCSGFFMDGKFYVLGGITRNHEQLTCGEEYDPIRNVWRTIENMYLEYATPPSFEPPPPLVAVAGNELYLIDASRNLLKAYEKATNSWTTLGMLPVRADVLNGWGLSLKALGDHLFLIGGQSYSSDSSEGMTKGIIMFVCKPQPGETLEWQLISSGSLGAGNFLSNCAVMAF